MPPSGIEDVRRRERAGLQRLQRLVFTGSDTNNSAVGLHDFDRHPLQPEFFSQSLGHRPQGVIEVLLAHQSDHVIQDKRFALALLRMAIPLLDATPLQLAL